MVGPLKERLKNGTLKLGGRPPAGLDMVLDALFSRLRNAGPWRDVPDGFGPQRTIYGWYKRLACQRIWEKLLRAFAKRSNSRIRLVDSTHGVAYQYAANPTGGAARQAMGRTRGGRDNKIIALTNAQGCRSNSYSSKVRLTRATMLSCCWR